METMTPERWETEHWFGRYPLASNNPAAEGSWRMPRIDALEKRFIQANPSRYVSQIVIDIDHADAELRAFALHQGGLVPNLFAYSTRPGHGQATFLLEGPVSTGDASRRQPINLLARIQQGLNEGLSGDRHYSGPLARNPTHPMANTRWCHPTPYGLRDLARGLGELLPRRPVSTRADDALDSALGRNCWMFDRTRKWAYRAWTRYPQRTDWDDAVFAYAWGRNPELVSHSKGPLPDSELLTISRSVASFVWNSEMRAKGVEQFEADFSKIQAIRGCKGGKAGGKIMTDKRREAIAETNRRRKVDRAAVLAELEA